MSQPDTAPDLSDISSAMNAVEGKTPSAVLAAFLPPITTHLGQTLVPLTAGHELALSQLGHPLATGSAQWEDVDVLTALFLFSRPSRLTFAMIAGGTFEAEFFAFIDTIPSADIRQLGSDMVAHWLRSRNSALAMESPSSTGQKKTAVLDGCSALSARLARSMGGLRTWFCTTFLSPRSSP